MEVEMSQQRWVPDGSGGYIEYVHPTEGMAEGLVSFLLFPFVIPALIVAIPLSILFNGFMLWGALLIGTNWTLSLLLPFLGLHLAVSTIAWLSVVISAIPMLILAIILFVLFLKVPEIWTRVILLGFSIGAVAGPAILVFLGILAILF